MGQRNLPQTDSAGPGGSAAQVWRREHLLALSPSTPLALELDGELLLLPFELSVQKFPQLFPSQTSLPHAEMTFPIFEEYRAATMFFNCVWRAKYSA